MFPVGYWPGQICHTNISFDTFEDIISDQDLPNNDTSALKNQFSEETWSSPPTPRY